MLISSGQITLVAFSFTWISTTNLDEVKLVSVPRLLWQGVSVVQDAWEEGHTRGITLRQSSLSRFDVGSLMTLVSLCGPTALVVNVSWLFPSPLKSALFSYRQSGCRAGLEPHSPRGPSVGRPVETDPIGVSNRELDCPERRRRGRKQTGRAPLTLWGWDLAQFSSRAKTPSLHSMIQCSSMGKDSTLVAAMAMPKPISRTRPPKRPERNVTYCDDILAYISYCKSLCSAQRLRCYVCVCWSSVFIHLFYICPTTKHQWNTLSH